MLGAIIGDIVGSRFEWHNHRSKDFELFTDRSMPTDDSIMTVGVAKGLLMSYPDYKDLSKHAIEGMQMIGRHYPYSGYGGMFIHWIFDENPQPYNSFGNGAAMRISPVGFAAESEEEVKTLSSAVTSVSHNHPEGLKGAEATAMCIFLARKGKTKEEIKNYVNEHYYHIDFTLDEIRDTYQFNETCQETVPQALEAFFESTDFEDCIRNAVSIGGDSDTIAAIAGGVAEAYYGIPKELKDKGLSLLDDRLRTIAEQFEETFETG